MTLADAIRLGGTLSPRHVTEDLFDIDGGSCALGGAGLAVGLVAAREYPATREFVEKLRDLCPELGNALGNSRCPICLDFCGMDIQDAVVHLNDDHLWTRDQIADFVESLVAPPPTEPAVETAEIAVTA